MIQHYHPQFQLTRCPSREPLGQGGHACSWALQGLQRSICLWHLLMIFHLFRQVFLLRKKKEKKKAFSICSLFPAWHQLIPPGASEQWEQQTLPSPAGSQPQFSCPAPSHTSHPAVTCRALPSLRVTGTRPLPRWDPSRDTRPQQHPGVCSGEQRRAQ